MTIDSVPTGLERLDKPRLLVDSINVRRSGNLVISNLTLTVNTGESVTILGRNGAGKSTLLEALSGLLPIDGGKITLDDEEVGHLSADRRARIGLALVPEGRLLFGGMSVQENLAVPLVAKRADSVTRRLQMERMWGLFPRLYELRKANARSLSGGQQQMLAIARALVQEPKVLLLDEPTFGLAPLVIEGVMETIGQLRKEAGIAVLMTEQNVDVAMAVSTRIALLAEGQLVHTAPPEDLRTEDIAKALFVG